ELTVPAGGMNQLIAAINAGADSIYLGYKKYGARAYAENFDLDQLKEVVSIAHNAGIKVYLALNTLIKDSELREVINFLRQYVAICRDGIIIQDFCLYKIVKDLFANIPLHASTQLNIHNTYSLKLIKRIGFKRAILARELTLEEIKNLCEKKLTEIEIFAHGSQCYSYSGSCYYSSFISGKSGNRGKCLQPCRMKYKLLEEKNGKYKYIIRKESYILSKNDLCLLDFIPALVKVGVDAIKIEGRMKSAEYTGIVTKIYRKYIDLYYNNPAEYRVDDYDVYKLAGVYSRDMGKGYMEHKYPGNIISLKKSGSTGNYLGRVYKLDYEDHDDGGKNKRKIKYIYVKSRWEINRGDILEVWTKKGNERITIKDFEKIDEFITGNNKEYRYKIKINAPCSILEKDRVFKYFDKKLNDEASDLYKHGIVRISTEKICLKDNSREHNILLDESKIKNYLDNFLSKKKLYESKKSESRITLTTVVYNPEFLELSVRNGAKRIIYNNFKELTESNGSKLDSIKLIKENSKDKDVTVCIGTPHIIHDDDFEIIKNNILRLLDLGIRDFVVANSGILELLLEISQESRDSNKINIYVSYNFNLFNILSVVFLKELIDKNCILKGIELSRELNIAEIMEIISSSERLYKTGKPEFSIFGHGYIPVMNSRYRLEYITGKKNRCKFYIEDVKGFRFPVCSDYNGNIIVFNSKAMCTLFDLEKIKENKVNDIILDSFFYSKNDLCKIIRSYNEAINILYRDGNQKYKKFVSSLQNDNLFRNYTKGHLMRGVE
ncbi:MAG: U32 family peptidase, partial [Actinomycetota bacterium]|nr:U32 family peptidase [Actinomycetota bacterium]